MSSWRGVLGHIELWWPHRHVLQGGPKYCRWCGKDRILCEGGLESCHVALPSITLVFSFSVFCFISHIFRWEFKNMTVPNMSCMRRCTFNKGFSVVSYNSVASHCFLAHGPVGAKKQYNFLKNDYKRLHQPCLERQLICVMVASSNRLYVCGPLHAIMHGRVAFFDLLSVGIY
jgi:hypothetical protein